MNANAHFIAWLKLVSAGNPNRYIWISPNAYLDRVKEKVYYHA